MVAVVINNIIELVNLARAYFIVIMYRSMFSGVAHRAVFMFCFVCCYCVCCIKDFQCISFISLAFVGFCCIVQFIDLCCSSFILFKAEFRPGVIFININSNQYFLMCVGDMVGIHNMRSS